MPIDSDAASYSPQAPPQTSPSVLAGMSGDDTGASLGAQPQPNQNEGMTQVMSTVRQVKATIAELAKQFPSAAAALRDAQKALEGAMKQIIANPGTPEPQAPAIGG